MTLKKTRFLFVDLETTGLNPERDLILEVAAVPVELVHRDDGGFNVSGMPDIARCFHRVLRYERNETLRRCNDDVLDMHVKSGLIRECCISTGELVPERAEEARSRAWSEFTSLCKRLVGYGEYDSPAFIAGFSVHFDVGFLRAHEDLRWETNMRRINNNKPVFSHRILDVSCFKLMWPDHFKTGNGVKAHRAKDDVIESIEAWLNGMFALEGSKFNAQALREMIGGIPV